MDLDEWEYLPDDGFLDFHEESEEKRRIFSSKRYSDSKNSVFNMNYFIIPSPNSRKIIQTPPPPQNSKVPQLVPVPIQLELSPKFGRVREEEEEEKEEGEPIEEKSVIVANKAEQDTLQSQVYFKKNWENEFADMKMDSPPKSPTYAAAAAAARFHQFDDDKLREALESQMITSPRCKTNEKDSSLLEAEEEDVKIEDDHDNNIWKLSLTGVGAICSFGFAAATICILFFGTHQKNKQYQHNHNRFQIYSDDKVVHHATKLNDAFSAVRGVPLTRAHVTYGGYYNAL